MINYTYMLTQGAALSLFLQVTMSLSTATFLPLATALPKSLLTSEWGRLRSWRWNRTPTRCESTSTGTVGMTSTPQSSTSVECNSTAQLLKPKSTPLLRRRSSSTALSNLRSIAFSTISTHGTSVAAYYTGRALASPTSTMPLNGEDTKTPMTTRGRTSDRLRAAVTW